MMHHLLRAAARAPLPRAPSRSAASRLFSGDRTGIDPERPEHVPEAGMGHIKETPPLTEEEKEVARANYKEAKEIQLKQMRAIGLDKAANRDPDPESGVNTAGTVTGTMEEFASGEKFRAMRGTGGQDPRDLRVKEELAAREGYKPPEAQAAEEEPHARRASEGEMKTRDPLPERAAHNVKAFLKEAGATLMHGVNNAGQPEIQQKMREIEEEEGSTRQQQQ